MATPTLARRNRPFPTFDRRFGDSLPSPVSITNLGPCGCCGGGGGSVSCACVCPSSDLAPVLHATVFGLGAYPLASNYAGTPATLNGSYRLTQTIPTSTGLGCQWDFSMNYGGLSYSPVGPICGYYQLAGTFSISLYCATNVTPGASGPIWLTVRNTTNQFAVISDPLDCPNIPGSETRAGTLSQPGGSGGGVVIMTVSGGAVTGVSSIPPPDTGACARIPVLQGNGYSVPSPVAITGDGTGATAVTVVSDGEVTGITITNGGSGYTFATGIIPIPDKAVCSPLLLTFDDYSGINPDYCSAGGVTGTYLAGLGVDVTL
ncbi:hypothetical protein [Fimbriiglobus ruber]|uniref:Uncharacterized protein n=1 Tax=Fimbriiglobus ruber TaxID=1908690 RepID=A0A225D8W4_9BACT|nr:hypothetical protein [Fimbriiglobus ruber]OWK34978.1 hypothetical protein FRUB_09820 [Fimbriiglobus ruber]